MKYLHFSILFLSFFLTFVPDAVSQQNLNRDDMSENPVRYIEIHDWGFYVAARVAILHHITIENKSSFPYTDIKIRVNYYSASPGTRGYKVGFQDKVLRITLPPGSKKTYLKEGLPIGAGSSQVTADYIQVLSARIPD